MKSTFFKIIHKNYSTHVFSDQERNIAEFIFRISAMDANEVLKELNTCSDGLSNDQIRVRRGRYGLNQIVHDRMKPWYIQLFYAFHNPFNYVLFLIAIVSAFTGDKTGVFIILIMVLLSVMIKFTQEYKSGKSAEALKRMVHTTCSVKRQNEKGEYEYVEIPMEELVPGDIIRLSAGDIIPADIRILQSKDLFISQSALTGEALPVEKDDKALLFNQSELASKSPIGLENICFMGTNVDIGSAVAVVITTGGRTYFGAMANTLIKKRVPTSFDIGIGNVSWLLIRFMFIMAPVVFFISGFTKGNWLDALLFALSVAVGLTPEMLPVVVTANLAKGAERMVKRKVIVKKLNAIQNFGAMNVLCTDKTGTLTEDRIVLIRHLDTFGNPSDEVLRFAFQNSYFQSGLRNLVDLAILEDDEVKNNEALKTEWHKVDEVPFDFVRRRMSVIIRHESNVDLLICKGAVEEMMAHSEYITLDGVSLRIEDKLRADIAETAKSLNEDGLRLLAVAHKLLEDQGRPFSVDDESELILDGFVAFLDPPKASAHEALSALNLNGIEVKVLTGDNEIVAQKVCREVGLPDPKVLLGTQVDQMSEAELSVATKTHNIYAKLSPMQKARIISNLRHNGATVGFMGDGINDAPALRESDIGISVDNAVDISKESADIILLQKSLMVLNDGVIEGRKTFANTMKYIKITASSNFGNVFSLIGASALFPFLPMLPIQILILNMLYDFSQISLPWDNVDKEYLRMPRKWEANDVKRFMLNIGLLSSIFDYLTFGVLYFFIQANTVESQGIFQTGWFLESLVTQTLVVQVLRTEKIPFIQSRPSLVVLLTAMLLLVFGFTMPYMPFAKGLGFATLPVEFYYWLTGISVCYLFISNYIKRRYIRKYQSWL